MHETRGMRIRRCTTWIAPLITMFFLLFVSVSALAVPVLEERLSDPFLEKRAQGLEKRLRCMICDGQALAESDASMAADMRRFLRKKIRQGESDAQILSWFRTRYGAHIDLLPPFRKETWVLWLVPFLLPAGALLWASRKARSRARFRT